MEVKKHEFIEKLVLLVCCTFGDCYNCRFINFISNPMYSLLRYRSDTLFNTVCIRFFTDWIVCHSSNA